MGPGVAVPDTNANFSSTSLCVGGKDGKRPHQHLGHLRGLSIEREIRGIRRHLAHGEAGQ